MAERVTVFWQGKEYDAVRSREAPAGPVWQVLRDGAPVTSFPADPTGACGSGEGKDSRLAARERVRPWTSVANEARPLCPQTPPGTVGGLLAEGGLPFRCTEARFLAAASPPPV